jgi:hypothetical protein
VAEENGPEVGGTGPAEVVGGAAVVVVGRAEDMIEPEQADTRLIGAGILPGLGRRLYGWKEGWRGAGRARRRVGAVIARKDETRLRVLTPEGVGNKYDLLLVSIRSITSVYIIVQLIKTLDKLGQALKSNRCWASSGCRPGQPGHTSTPRVPRVRVWVTQLI